MSSGGGGGEGGGEGGTDAVRRGKGLQRSGAKG